MRVLKSASLMIVGMVVLMAWLLSSSLALADEEIENMVKGGDFEEDIDLTHWNLAAFNAVATMERDKKESAVGDASLFIEITKVDPAVASVPQLRQLPYGTAMTVEKGKTYTLSVFLKAEEERKLFIVVFREVPSYAQRIKKTVTVGTDWKEYWVTGTIPQDELVAITFTNAGERKVNYWIDGIRFYEGEYVPTEVDGVQKAVVALRSKLTTTWASIKAQY